MKGFVQTIIFAIILIIGVLAILVIIVPTLSNIPEIIKAASKFTRYTFCCNILRCQPAGLRLPTLQDPICAAICWGCACGEACE